MYVCVRVRVYVFRKRVREKARGMSEDRMREERRERAREIYKRRNNGLQNAPVALYTFAYRVLHSVCVATCERNPKPPTFLPSFLPPFVPAPIRVRAPFAMCRFSSEPRLSLRASRIRYPYSRDTRSKTIGVQNMEYYIL